MNANQIARDFDRVIKDVPVTFELDGIEYEGTRGALVTAKHVIEGGLFVEPELVITTAYKKVNSSNQVVDRFPIDGAPVVTNALRKVGGMTGRDYRIVRTHEDEFGVVLQMDCESVHK